MNGKLRERLKLVSLILGITVTSVSASTAAMIYLMKSQFVTRTEWDDHVQWGRTRSENLASIAADQKSILAEVAGIHAELRDLNTRLGRVEGQNIGTGRENRNHDPAPARP